MEGDEDQGEKEEACSRAEEEEGWIEGRQNTGGKSTLKACCCGV